MCLESGLKQTAHSEEIRYTPLNTQKRNFLFFIAHLVESHPVHFDCLRKLALRKVYVSHIQSQAACLRKLLVLQDYSIGVHGFLDEAVYEVHVCHRKHGRERQIQVEALK